MPGDASPSTASRPGRTVLARGLYALADVDAAERAGLDVVECARAMHAAGSAALQLRAKPWSGGEFVDGSRRLMQALDSEGAPLFINDRADIAHLVDAAGVHVGQDDLPPQELGGVGAIGLSTHNQEQLRQALGLGVLSYVALGPIYPTSSKANPDPVVGLQGLKDAHEKTKHSGVPLVAIGGIDDKTLRQTAESCDLIAAIGLLYPEPGSSSPYSFIERRCRQLQEAVCSIEPLAS